MRILTGKQEIADAQEKVIKWLLKHCNEDIPVKIGHQGVTLDYSINWSPYSGLWFYSKLIKDSRYWNAFGLTYDEPSSSTHIPIVCEINPPIEGLNRRTQGVFIETDDKKILLAHRGKIGGGRPGVGRKLFFDNYTGLIKEINGRKFAILGDIGSSNIVLGILRFVREIDRIKKFE